MIVMNLSRVRIYINIIVVFLYLFKKGSRTMKYLLLLLSNRIIFRPMKAAITFNNLDSVMIKKETMLTSDNISIDACLFNSYKKPSYDDNIIFLYSHGNSGYIEMITESNTVKYLSKYGSVFIYDYRGYGISTGKPSDSGLFIDSLTVWTFLVKVKQVPPQNIILFGHSLGTSVTANLMLNIVKTESYTCKCNNGGPLKMILQNPFFSIQRLIDDHVPFKISNIIQSKFNTNLFFKQIDSLTNNIMINIIHSHGDKLISSEHSVDLQKLIVNNKCQLFLVPGSHETPVYNNSIDQMMFDITSPIINNATQYD